MSVGRRLLLELVSDQRRLAVLQLDVEVGLMEPIRLLLADDSPAILDMVVNLLKPHFAIAGAFTDGELVLQKFSSLMPDVTILDICMGNVSGFDVARRLKEMDCTAKFIFLTVHEDPDFVQAARSLGASGYVFKSAVNSDLIAAIEAVSKGQLYYPNAVPIAHCKAKQQETHRRHCSFLSS